MTEVQEVQSLVEGRWIPRDYRLVGRNGTAEVFAGETVTLNGVERFYAIGYGGKRTKPDFHNSYRNAEHRAEHVAAYFTRLDEAEERKQARKAERSKPHTLKVGDILSTCWGYDQTNVEFFEVTKVISGHTVELREIAQHYVATGWMQGRTRPKLGAYISEPIRKRANSDNSCKMSKWGRWATPTTQHGEHFTSSYA